MAADEPAVHVHGLAPWTCVYQELETPSIRLLGKRPLAQNERSPRSFR